MKILLVDDDVLLARGASKLLARLGEHQVETTASPETVFEKCHTETIDLLIIDVNLPGAMWQGQEINGVEISRLLKEDPETAHIPIVLITAYGSANDQDALLTASRADHFWVKPIGDYQKLLDLVK